MANASTLSTFRTDTTPTQIVRPILPLRRITTTRLFFDLTAAKTGEKCDANVETCICSGKGCATSCSKTYLLRPDGTCSLECPGGTYGDKIGGVCVPCDPSALTCTSEGATSWCGTRLLSRGGSSALR